jgi:peptidoglycan/xylan/chitin deacetylase (PgdA/CDA1 family)
VQVVHGDDTTTVRVGRGRTVGGALDKAGVRGTAGRELAVTSKEPLGPNGNEPTYLVDGEPGSRDQVIDAATTIEVVDGEDTVEPTEVVRRTQPVTGLPDALQYVQFAGKAGAEDATVGSTSGEVVERTPVGESVPAHRATGKVLALTFDDGPNPAATPRVLDILRKAGVPATFCTIGTQVRAQPKLVKRIVAEGHQLCNHTLDHVEGLETQPRERVESEIEGGRDAIVEVTGEPPAFYRPPGGSLGPVIYEVAAANDEAVLYWSIDPLDWKKPSRDELVASVLGQLKPGGIILLHDGGGDREATVAALPAIIEGARAQGYTFVAPISGRPQVG